MAMMMTATVSSETFQPGQSLWLKGKKGKRSLVYFQGLIQEGGVILANILVSDNHNRYTFKTVHCNCLSAVEEVANPWEGDSAAWQCHNDTLKLYANKTIDMDRIYTMQWHGAFTHLDIEKFQMDPVLYHRIPKTTEETLNFEELCAQLAIEQKNMQLGEKQRRGHSKLYEAYLSMKGGISRGQICLPTDDVLSFDEMAIFQDVPIREINPQKGGLYLYGGEKGQQAITRIIGSLTPTNQRDLPSEQHKTLLEYNTAFAHLPDEGILTHANLASEIVLSVIGTVLHNVVAEGYCTVKNRGIPHHVRVYRIGKDMNNNQLFAHGTVEALGTPFTACEVTPTHYQKDQHRVMIMLNKHVQLPDTDFINSESKNEAGLRIVQRKNGKNFIQVVMLNGKPMPSRLIAVAFTLIDTDGTTKARLDQFQLVPCHLQEELGVILEGACPTKASKTPYKYLSAYKGDDWTYKNHFEHEASLLLHSMYFMNGFHEESKQVLRTMYSD